MLALFTCWSAPRMMCAKSSRRVLCFEPGKRTCTLLERAGLLPVLPCCLTLCAICLAPGPSSLQARTAVPRRLAGSATGCGGRGAVPQPGGPALQCHGGADPQGAVAAEPQVRTACAVRSTGGYVLAATQARSVQVVGYFAARSPREEQSARPLKGHQPVPHTALAHAQQARSILGIEPKG